MRPVYLHKARLVVLVSGNGSNLQAIIDAIKEDQLSAEICQVVSNRLQAFALQRAEKAGIPVSVLIKVKEITREEYDTALADLVEAFQPDLVILAGWMRILSMNFLSRFPGKVMNLHPALPGMFPGTHAIERAYQAYQSGEIKNTGIMVHLVPDEGVDDGPVLETEEIPIFPEDTLEKLEERVHACEHKLLVKSIRDYLKNT